MSNDSNRNGDMQDYLDLLNMYAGDKKKATESVSFAEKKSQESRLKATPVEDVVDSDFFEDDENRSKGDIDMFFEAPKKATAQKASPPPMKTAPKAEEKTVKMMSPPPMAEKKAEEAPQQETYNKNISKADDKKMPVVKNVIRDENLQEESEAPEKEKNPVKRIAAWFNALPKKKKIIVSIVAIILVIVLILTTIVGVFIDNKFDLLGDNTGIIADDDIIYEEEEIGDIEIDIGSAGFKQSLIDWATTGNDRHMSSKNVVNVLLIGADSRKGKNEGNTDVMMLVSVNRKTKELKMVSFLRDSYLYIEGDSSSYCTKLNAAYSMGGPDCLIKTIENNYKIEIDNYVMVNFESFKAIIDEMGGINVDVQEYEANYINKSYKVNIPSGENVTLNGKQALAFCRVRNCDSDGDVSRTRRQRQVIDSMVTRVMSSSISEINKYIDVLLPYVDTGYSESQVLSLGLKAIAGGWAKYERTQLSMPSEDCRTAGSANMWIWVVDYQQAAYELQMEIYGESNIVLDENRVSIIDVYNGANYTGPSASIDKNDSDDETEVPNTTELKTTLPETTKQDTPQTTEAETSQDTSDAPEPIETTTQEKNPGGWEEEPSTDAQEEPTGDAPIEEETMGDEVEEPQDE